MSEQYGLKQVYNKGYKEGQRLYTEDPNLNFVSIRAWADVKIICGEISEQERNDYETGIFDGHLAAATKEAKG